MELSADEVAESPTLRNEDDSTDEDTKASEEHQKGQKEGKLIVSSCGIWFSTVIQDTSL